MTEKVELAPDEVVLVSVFNGALSPESIERLLEFIEHVRANPEESKPLALLLEAEPLDALNPSLPGKIEIKTMKRSEIAATDIVIREARDDG